MMNILYHYDHTWFVKFHSCNHKIFSIESLSFSITEKNQGEFISVKHEKQFLTKSVLKIDKNSVINTELIENKLQTLIKGNRSIQFNSYRKFVNDQALKRLVYKMRES